MYARYRQGFTFTLTKAKVFKQHVVTLSCGFGTRAKHYACRTTIKLKTL